MLVCIDHGNKQIKTTSRTFTSGLMESDTRPPFGDNIMFYNGKYYTLSDQRIPYIRDKTEDDRFFILTLFAIAYEINAAGRYAPDQLMDIQLAVGLPPAHYGTQYKRFAQYFLERGMIGFEFNGKVYSICITEAICFPQALAATAPVCGTSGAGKTFLILLMALRMRRKGIQVFMLAPLKGHEFHRACVNTGGEFISISPASKSCINVLEIRKVDKSVEAMLDGPGIERSELAAKIQRLHIFFALLIPDMSYEEKQLLDDALIRTYARKGITHDNASLHDPDNPDVYRQMPVLGDLYDVLKEESDTKRLSNIINRFVHGSASTFNQQTNVNLDNKFTVLDISELSGDLLPIGMFVALDFVWDKAKANRTEEKAIFIDECWQLIGGGSGTFGVGNRLAAEMVLEIFKTIRAYSGSGICATQDLNDFFSLDNGKYGKGIINNCRTKVILNLEDEEAQRVQQVLHLSEAEVMEITHFERGNGLISSNNNNITVEFKASPLERDLITTDRRELLDLLRRMGQQVKRNCLFALYFQAERQK